MHFSSLIHKMSMLTLVISCLTMSNLPWFMNLTFQVPMQYCSLQHWTLLSLPDIVATECHFHFGPVTSFFLELLLYHNCPLLFPSRKLDIFWPGRAHLPVSYRFAFSYCSWSSHSRILEWFAICCPSRPHFVRTFHYDPSILGGYTWHGSQLYWVMQAPLAQQGCDPWSRKKVNWLSEKPLQIAEERRDMKGKGERERYTQLNAEFQRIARRNKKAFLKEQYKNREKR